MFIVDVYKDDDLVEKVLVGVGMSVDDFCESGLSCVELLDKVL